MKNIKLFIFNILLLLECGIAFADYNIEFKVNKYKNIDDYDIIYFQNKKQIVKDIYKNRELVHREGSFPNGKIKFINYFDIVVASVNIKDNKFDGLCVFFEVTGNVIDRAFNLNKRIESNYKEGILDGTTTIFDEENRVSCILNYTKGKLNGEAVYFNYEDNFKKTVDFVDGNKNTEKIVKFQENEKK